VKILIVVPTYNEIDNLRPLSEAIFSNVPPTVQVLIVDDGSPDGTGTLADEIARENPRFHVMHRLKKMGLGTAYVQGFKWGLEKGFDALIEMDADFSHNPSYLPKMIQLLEKNDVVIGSRYVEGGGTLNWGVGRKILSRGGSFYSRMILGAPIRDFTGGFNGWKRKVLEAVDLPSLRSDGYSFQIELKYRAHLKQFKITEFPIVFEDRKVGKSKMSKKIVFEALGRVWGFRWRSSLLQSGKSNAS
jgi:dolichol-phosphate mannosyltransferase